MAGWDGLKAALRKFECKGAGEIGCIIALSFDGDKPGLRICQELVLQIPEAAVKTVEFQ